MRAVNLTLCVPSSTKSSSSESSEQIELSILRPSALDGTRYLRVSVPFVLVRQFRLNFIISLSFSASKIPSKKVNLFHSGWLLGFNMELSQLDQH
jgi:hypothetical protein